MFRKLTDRISAAASSAANALSGTDETERGVQALQSMGFSANDARNALQASGGNVDRAAEFLLANATNSAPRPPSSNTNARQQQKVEAEFNRALQASVETEEARQLEEARKASASQKKAPPSAASSRAGQATAARAAAGQAPFAANNKAKVSAAHPDVKVPVRLSNKPKEEQLLRCADRMKAHPRAVDTLYIALTSIQKDPDNDKFRKIDKTTAGYQRSLAKAPGAEGMFKAMNFTTQGSNTLVLTRDQVDAALLYLGISALETTQQSPEYKEGKRKLQFEKQIQTIFANSDGSEQEAVKRANHMSKCPSEPSGGRGALITVKIADREPIRRKFDGDDTLEDILNWLGGVASALPEKLLSREWSLVDMNRYPLVPTDCEEDRSKTLQYVGFFPSGRLEVIPSTEAWHLKESMDLERGSARGLGAAPR